MISGKICEHHHSQEDGLITVNMKHYQWSLEHFLGIVAKRQCIFHTPS